MALPNYLANIKSSGMYRFVWDKSEIPGEEAQTLRLVVGYSEKGIFNTPVYIDTPTKFKTIFGGISKKLERNGCFFHRMALQALSTGPIIALNIKTFDTESVDAGFFNVSDCILDNDVMKKIGVPEVYNTNRFWKLEPEHLEDIAIDKGSNDKYVLFTHTDENGTSNTIFMRGYMPSNYNITFKEWYSAVLNGEDMPAYINQGGPQSNLDFSLRKLNQYFAEIYVFRGEFTKEIATSENLAKYFIVSGDDVKLQPYMLNAFGERIDTLDALAQNSTSNFINKYQGILLPEFQSSTGGVISLDDVFNADYDNHKMMLRLNQGALYAGTVTLDTITTTGWVRGVTGGPFDMMSAEDIYPTITETNDGGATYTNKQNGSVIVDGNGNPVKDIVPTYYKYDQLGTVGESAPSMQYTVYNVDNITFNKGDYYLTIDEETDLTPTGSLKPEVTTLVDVTPIIRESIGKYVATNELTEEPKGKMVLTSTLSGTAETVAVAYTTVTGETDAQVSGDIISLTKAMHTAQYDTVEYDSTTYEWSETDKDYKESDNNHKLSEMLADDIVSPYSAAVNMVFSNEDEVSVTLNVAITEGSGTETGISWVDGTTNKDFTLKYVLTFDKNVYTLLATIPDTSVIQTPHLFLCNNALTATSEGMTPLYVQGYTKENTKPIPTGTYPATDDFSKNAWINNYILSAFTLYPGLREGLTNNVDSEWHYLVDTFQAFVEAECHSKLAIICKEKDNALGLINFPKMKSFINCTYASFRDGQGNFQMRYVADGCNKTAPHDTIFSVCSEDNGASYMAYFSPVIIEENTGIKVTCPSAALVSNAYMAKYDTRYPYSIVAGPNYSVISAQGLIGPDYNFSRSDKDILEPLGINVLVYEPRKGTYINSNQTAKQNPVTTLSKINVRELVIFLQDEIEKLLQDYQWEFNTQSLRDTVKNRADVILEKAKCNGGVYKYLNICDLSNNTDDVINNEMLVLTTSIEPGMGAGKMVQELVLYRRGGMSSVTIQ